MSGLTHVLFEEFRAPGVQSMILKSGPPFLIFIKSRAYKLFSSSLRWRAYWYRLMSHINWNIKKSFLLQIAIHLAEISPRKRKDGSQRDHKPPSPKKNKEICQHNCGGTWKKWRSLGYKGVLEIFFFSIKDWDYDITDLLYGDKRMAGLLGITVGFCGTSILVNLWKTI